MKNTIETALFLIVFLSSAFAWTPVRLPPNHSINSTNVWVNDSNVYISANPHTLHSSGWVYFTLKSKVYSGNIDLALGFNSSGAVPKRAELYNPHTVINTILHSYTIYNVSSYAPSAQACEIGINSAANHFKVSYYAPVYDNATNKTSYELRNIIVCFDSYEQNDNDYTVHWNTQESHIENWNNLASKFNKISFIYNNFNSWYYTTGLSISANTEYKIRIWFDIPVIKKSTGEYLFAVKPSSETLSQAKNNGHLYWLGPWWDSSWTKRKAINLTTSSGTTPSGYQVLLNVSYESSMQADFDDLRFVDNDDSTLLPAWLENKSDGDWATIWVKVNDTIGTGGTTIYMYYGNSGASSYWNGENTFEFFDDFLGTSLNTSKWSSNGNVSVADSKVDIYYDGSNRANIHSNTTFDPPIIEEWYGNQKADDDLEGFQTTDLNSLIAIQVYTYASPDGWRIVAQTGSSSNRVYQNNLNGPLDTDYHHWRIDWVNDSFTKHYEDSTVLGNLSSSYVPDSNMPLGFDTWDDTGHFYVDYVFVRKYADPEPNASFGSEEDSTGSVGCDITLNSPADNTNTSDSTPTFNATATCYGSMPTKCYLTMNSTASGDNSTAITNGSWFTITANSTKSDGSYIWNITCTNATGGGFYTNTSASRTINIDATAPVINIYEPSGDIYYTHNDYMNITGTDANLVNISCNLSNASGVINTYTNSSPVSGIAELTSEYNNANSLELGTYNINCSAYDTAGNKGTGYKLFNVISDSYLNVTADNITVGEKANLYAYYNNVTTDTKISGANCTYNISASGTVIRSGTLNELTNYYYAQEDDLPASDYNFSVHCYISGNSYHEQTNTTIFTVSSGNYSVNFNINIDSTNKEGWTNAQCLSNGKTLKYTYTKKACVGSICKDVTITENTYCALGCTPGAKVCNKSLIAESGWAGLLIFISLAILFSWVLYRRIRRY